MSDIDYQAALVYADNSQKTIYEREALFIDKLQKNILSIVHKEDPFDVFLCYKESDENGKRTKDSVIANEIYHQLTQEGFKVFYSAITLEDKLGQEYEPYIFAALNSSKVMLVIGSKPEYFNAIWVKNEWNRYLNIVKNDYSKLLISCYKDMDAYDLPEEFSHLQAQDMSKIGFINDVIRGIRKVLHTEQTVILTTPYTMANNTTQFDTDPLLKRIELFLEDGEFDRADDFCEQVLNHDPMNADAYLYKLMIENQCTTKESLSSLDHSIKDSKNYSKVIRFGNEEQKEFLSKAEDDIQALLKKKEEDKTSEKDSHKRVLDLDELEHRFDNILPIVFNSADIISDESDD